ncbi:hypothetical protein KPATCC21470_7036 [Kitasatospora purpeofusca]
MVPIEVLTGFDRFSPLACSRGCPGGARGPDERPAGPAAD